MERPFTLPDEETIFSLAELIYINPETLRVHVRSAFDREKALIELTDEGELSNEGVRLEVDRLEHEHLDAQHAKALIARMDTAKLVNDELHRFTDGRPPLWETLSHEFGGREYRLNWMFIGDLYTFVHDHCSKMPHDESIERHASNAIPRLMLMLFELIFADDVRRVSGLSGLWRRRNHIPVDRTSGALIVTTEIKRTS